MRLNPKSAWYHLIGVNSVPWRYISFLACFLVGTNESILAAPTACNHQLSTALAHYELNALESRYRHGNPSRKIPLSTIADACRESPRSLNKDEYETGEALIWNSTADDPKIVQDVETREQLDLSKHRFPVRVYFEEQIDERFDKVRVVPFPHVADSNGVVGWRIAVPRLRLQPTAIGTMEKAIKIFDEVETRFSLSVSRIQRAMVCQNMYGMNSRPI